MRLFQPQIWKKKEEGKEWLLYLTNLDVWGDMDEMLNRFERSIWLIWNIIFLVTFSTPHYLASCCFLSIGVVFDRMTHLTELDKITKQFLINTISMSEISIPYTCVLSYSIYSTQLYFIFWVLFTYPYQLLYFIQMLKNFILKPCQVVCHY